MSKRVTWCGRTQTMLDIDTMPFPEAEEGAELCLEEWMSYWGDGPCVAVCLHVRSDGKHRKLFHTNAVEGTFMEARQRVLRQVRAKVAAGDALARLVLPYAERKWKRWDTDE